MTDLPPFSANPTCPKCGGDCTSRHWFAGSAQMPECHILICLGCNHVWTVAPLDATNADDEPEDAYLAGKLAEREAEPSIPVSRIVAVLAERYMDMHDGKQRRAGIDRANYHIRSLEAAWTSAALGLDHEFDAAVAELARQRLEAE